MATTIFVPSMLRGAGTRGVPEIPAGSSFTNTYSMAFDGTDDSISITKTSAYTTTTLSMWVKTDKVYGVNVETSVASNNDFNQGRDFFIGDTPTSTNDAYIGMWAGAAVRGKVSGGIKVNDGNWHHLAWTYDSSAGTSAAINMYVDGVNQFSQAANTSYWTREIKYQHFGLPKVSDSYFEGNMDEVSIWGTVLSAADVLTLYNSGVPSDLSSALSSTPEGWWRMGDGATFSTNWTIPDDSTNSNSGTSANMDSADREEDVPS
tara:strand:+ start:276 stop:1061 length:786 start_codon:yes stop_codon:yes gene_type:complete